MSTSGTSSFTLDFADIVREAYERIGKTSEETEGTQLRSARRSMALMLLDWSARGANLWAIESATAATVQGVATMTTVAGTIDVLDVTITDSTGTELILSSMGRESFVMIPAKTLQARPTSYWINRSIAAPSIVLYPTPDVGPYTLTYWRLRRLQDLTAATQTLDVPDVWLEAVCAGLAARLAVKWAPARVTMLQPLAEAALKNAMAFNEEHTAAILTPDLSGFSIG